MRKKRHRFQANKFLNHLIEPGKPIYGAIKGKWNPFYFGNHYPITLEIGCGHGAHTIGLAKMFPERNFIGIDIKGDRLWQGAQQAKESMLQNVAFLRTDVTKLLDFFVKNEVAEIWITFPDPRPKNRDSKRRLTSIRFLKLYTAILIEGGHIHLKTDSDLLAKYTIDVLAAQGVEPLYHTNDLYQSTFLDNHYAIETTYEKRFVAQGVAIHYLCFQLPSVDDLR